MGRKREKEGKEKREGERERKTITLPVARITRTVRACAYACAGGFERSAHDDDDDDVDDVHDYYDTAWGLHEDPLVGFWLPILQSPAGNDISRDSVEGAPARRYIVCAVPLS